MISLYSARLLAAHKRSLPSSRLQARRAVAMSAASGMIVTDPDEAIQIAGAAKRVAVLGIKTEEKAGQPAFFVPEYLQEHGVEIIPVPVYYPDVKEILGRPVVRDLRAIRQPVDILDVFRRPQDLPQHLGDILAMDPRPAVVWLQSGISHPEFEQQLAAAGIKVVVSRCLKVDYGAALAAGAARGGRSAL